MSLKKIGIFIVLSLPFNAQWGRSAESCFSEDQLPQELLPEIFSFMGFRELLRMQETAPSFKDSIKKSLLEDPNAQAQLHHRYGACQAESQVWLNYLLKKYINQANAVMLQAEAREEKQHALQLLRDGLVQTLNSDQLSFATPSQILSAVILELMLWGHINDHVAFQLMKQWEVQDHIFKRSFKGRLKSLFCHPCAQLDRVLIVQEISRQSKVGGGGSMAVSLLRHLLLQVKEQIGLQPIQAERDLKQLLLAAFRKADESVEAILGRYDFLAAFSNGQLEDMLSELIPYVFMVYQGLALKVRTLPEFKAIHSSLVSQLDLAASRDQNFEMEMANFWTSAGERFRQSLFATSSFLLPKPHIDQICTYLWTSPQDLQP